ncbi:MAG TPA: serine/threonine-protein kinase [Polyangia bacterium]
MASQIGRYQLVACIGRGGMAQVYHARAQGIGGFERDVALKVLLPEYASEPDFVTMLLDEARIAGAILHPCVVGVLDVGRQDELFYLVMEYVDGCDLRSILRARPGGRLPLTAGLHLASEVLRGLSAVHSAVDRSGEPRRIVHRDVSPANVLVAQDGVVKLGDFGIAHASSRITRTRNGAVKGKLRYMAPEQLSGLGVDHRADLYAVGIMLCEMLLGQEACEPRRMTKYGAVFSWASASQRHAPDQMPPDVARILDRALAENPAARYRDAAAFRKELAAALARRSPGYGAEELIRDLADAPGSLEDPEAFAEVTEVATVQQKGRLSADGELELSDTGALFGSGDELKPTAPFRPMEPNEIDPFPAPPTVTPYATLRSPLARWSGRRLGMVAAVAGASILSLTLAIVLGSSSPVAATPIAPPAVAFAHASPTVTPATGKLSVTGPIGTRVEIGSTSYPPAPCVIELPAGNYRVKLRRHAHARPVIREVTIEPAQELTLSL